MNRKDTGSAVRTHGVLTGRVMEDWHYLQRGQAGLSDKALWSRDLRGMREVAMGISAGREF